MMRVLCAAVVIIVGLAATAFAQRPAQASEAPWCLISGASGDEHCTYNSLDDCLRDRRGSSFCNPNPAYRGAEQPQRKHLRR
jgi:hypothetical protein